LLAALADWLCAVAKCAQEASMPLLEVHSAASEGIADALIAAEAMRTAILLMTFDRDAGIFLLQSFE